MILALLLAAAPVPSAAAPPLTADTAEAQAAATRSRVLWGIGGNLRLKAGDPATAAKDFDQGLAIPGGSPLESGELLLDRARAAQASGDLVTAETRSAEAARLVPDDPFLWYFRATLAVAASDVPRAKIAIARALRLAPNDPTILFESGHVASLAGEDAAARTAWQKALAADPNGPTGQRAREALGLVGVPLTVK
jgi:tetratricopeptide (TPR) repeat protein